MITLSKDNGFVKVERWEDIQSLPGFVSNLNPSEHKLKAIIGRYIFKDHIKCGLSNCHTAHGKGYIATTMDGFSINIGKDCGKNYFGVDFETLSKKFDRDYTESENRDYLWSFSFKIEEIEDKMYNLRNSAKGADWVYKKSQHLLMPGCDCPNEVVRQISSMVKAGTSTFSIQRNATESEIQTAEVQAGKKIQLPYIVEEPVADIAGFETLKPENNLKKMLIDDLATNLKSFKSKNIDTLSYEELRDWVKWAHSVENTIEAAQKITTLGTRLLTKENLGPFNALLKTKQDISKFRSYLKSLES